MVKLQLQDARQQKAFLINFLVVAGKLRQNPLRVAQSLQL